MKKQVKHIRAFFRNKKVFGIGFNKTGTTSLTAALEELGYFVAPEYRFDILLRDWVNKDWSKLVWMTRFWDAFQDVPFSFPGTYKILDREYPNSKFILTIRDEEKWYNSITSFHSKLWGNGSIPTAEDLYNSVYRYKGWPADAIFGLFNTNEANPYDRDQLITTYHNHICDVKNYFEKRPDDLLVVDLSEESAHIKLCNFLGKDQSLLKDGMPWINKTKDK